MSGLQGADKLVSRLRAVGNTRDLNRQMGLLVLREQKLLIPRATGASGRSGHLEELTDRGVKVVFTGGAVFSEEGTKPHIIVPTRAKVLRFAPEKSGRRLSGRPRKNARVVFAKRVRHPGTKALHWAARGISAAAGTLRLAASVIDRWNSAA